MRLELPGQKKLVHEMTMPVRWGDMDVMGHVNNTVYFRYMETARIEWFRSIGCSPGPQEAGPVVLNAFCNFYQQLAYPAELLVKTYVSDPARATFDSWTTIERLDQPGVIHAAGGATIVWADMAAQKSQTLPDWMRRIVA